jgi:GxxExxY protein
VDSAIAVHRELGPGLLESIYEQALAYELEDRGLRFERQKPINIAYKGRELDGQFRLDFVVEGLVVVELKSVLKLEPVYQAQLLSYLKLSGIRLGLLLNFNVKLMRDGVRRLVLGPE